MPRSERRAKVVYNIAKHVRHFPPEISMPAVLTSVLIVAEREYSEGRAYGIRSKPVAPYVE